MSRKLLVLTGIIVGIGLLAYAIWKEMDYRYTKQFSPEEEVVFSPGNLEIRVLYNRPYKKGRRIFGGLVPFDSVWRTGANEATIFETNRPLTIKGTVLPAGSYSLWTVPREHTWTIIFNSETGQWGINVEGKANRDPVRDVLQVEVQSIEQSKEFEQFTITFEEIGREAEMTIMWDKTIVMMPFHY